MKYLLSLLVVFLISLNSYADSQLLNCTFLGGNSPVSDVYGNLILGKFDSIATEPNKHKYDIQLKIENIFGMFTRIRVARSKWILDRLGSFPFPESPPKPVKNKTLEFGDDSLVHLSSDEFLKTSVIWNDRRGIRREVQTRWEYEISIDPQLFLDGTVSGNLIIRESISSRRKYSYSFSGSAPTTYVYSCSRQ